VRVEVRPDGRQDGLIEVLAVEPMARDEMQALMV
jgi:hypothetical protein